MRGHVDAESMALCADGLLSRRRSERIRAHVATCPECAATQARLAEVPALLAQVPPTALPPGITARLDAALSAETARRTSEAPGQAPERAPDLAPEQAASARSPGAVPGPRALRRRGPRLPVAARVLAVAGVLIVAGGVGYVVTQSSPPTSTASSSAGRAAPAPCHSAVARPNVPALGSTFTVTHSGTSYQPLVFAHQAATVLAHSSTGLMHPGIQPGQSRRSGPALTQCVIKAVGPQRAREVKLVDRARYQGHPATVIVVARTAAEPAQVYVAGTRCSGSDADILAQARMP
jgi:negative regulator of sigma E activity